MKESTFVKYCHVIDEWLTNGRNGTAAYKKLYPNVSDVTADGNFRKIHENTRIQNYLKSKETAISEKHEITIDSIIEELEAARKAAMKGKQYGAAVGASKEKAKLLGLYEKHNEQKNPLTANDFSSFIDKILA